MDQPTTSKEDDETKDGQQLKVENIGPQTTKLLKRIIWKLNLDQKSTTKSIPLSYPILRTARYTGVNKANVEKILAFGESLKFDSMVIDRQIIHTELMHMYLNKHYIPTIIQLFNALSDKLPIYVDIDYFTKFLHEMGYVFYKFPSRKSLRVMERKTVTFERYKYLKSIIQYRKDNVPVVYIGIASITKNMNVINLEKTFQTNTEDILNHILFTATNEAVEHIQVIPPSSYDVLKVVVKEWLLEKLVTQTLPQGSVCVFEDSKIFRETVIDVPTWKSVKADMVEWLEEHNISSNLDMSKLQLLKLIETCTDTQKNTFVLDYLFETYNYALLRLPQCINGLSIAALIIRFLNHKLEIRDMDEHLDTSDVMHNLSDANLNRFSCCVQLEEQQHLETDIKLDNVLDALVKDIKTSVIFDEENEDETVLPILSDSD